MTPNIGGWYKRKWKAYIPTKEEEKWLMRWQTWIPEMIAIVILAIVIWLI